MLFLSVYPEDFKSILNYNGVDELAKIPITNYEFSSIVLKKLVISKNLVDPT